MFGKKKAEKIGRRIAVPEGHMEKAAELLDAYHREKSHLNNYRLWKFIGEIIPEIKEGSWQMDATSAVKFFLEELIDDPVKRRSLELSPASCV
jgi:hypothetical protein